MSCFSMRENKGGKTPDQWLPLPWEQDDDYDDEPPISDEDKQELLDLMASINAQNAATATTDNKSGKE